MFAFLAIYVLWGATFLAIRVAVLDIPPLFTAGVRFVTAGGLLFGFTRLRGRPNPTWLPWRNLSILTFFMFVATYGALFWAEQYVSSGVTAVIQAALPITTFVLEVFVFRQQPLRWAKLPAVVLGFCGVALLLYRQGADQIPVIPCIFVL